ncbi:MAG TPA: hypothetical protein VF424_01385 [Vicinamibacterales bacterium]
MQILGFLTQAGAVALLSMFVGVIPLGVAVAYAIRPSEHRLALLRPLSLATVFASLTGLVAGLANVLRSVAVHDIPLFSGRSALGLSEALVPMFVGFGCLTIAWLCVATGLWRHP